MNMSPPIQKSNTQRIDVPHVSNYETLGNTCSLYVKVRDHWIKAKTDITYKEALMIGMSASQRSELPVQIRNNGDVVLADL